MSFANCRLFLNSPLFHLLTFVQMPLIDTFSWFACIRYASFITARQSAVDQQSLCLMQLTFALSGQRVSLRQRSLIHC